MQFKAGRGIQLYYFLISVVVLVALTGWFFFFFKSGALNSEMIQAVSESSIEIDRLHKENLIAQIDILTSTGKIREAALIVNSIEKITRLMDRNVGHFEEQYQDLSKRMTLIKAQLANLASLPDVMVVLGVLHRKFDQFHNFSKENNWPTLSRISSVLTNELDYENTRKNDVFNFVKIQKIQNNLDRNIKTMEKITAGSNLSQFEKSTILSRLQGFKVELDMLSQYLPELKKYQDSYQGLNNSYKAWIKQIGPQIAMTKMNFQKGSQLMFLSFAIILAFLFTSLLIGWWIFRQSVAGTNKKIENKILESLQEGIIASEFRLNDSFSSEFYAEMKKYHSWVKNRMSFGNIFQEALPFPSLLLDSNLNLVWANNLFYSEWNLNEYKNKRDALNWEFLQRFTNLGENDPILEALKNNLAGIYQIQVKRENNDSLPYEMYVSPVLIDDQKRIMVFFYPLGFLEETINEQKKSLVGPVTRSLEIMIKGDFNKEFREKIREDFNIAGIESVFGKFISLSEFLNQQKNGLVSEIERLENELYDKHKLLGDVKKSLEDQNNFIKNEVANFKESRDLIIKLVELRRKTEQIYLNTINASKIMLKEQINLHDQSLNLVENYNENVKIYKNIITSKDGFKEALNRLDECKTNMSQTLEQTLIFTKSAKINPDNFAQSLMKIKLELRALEKEVGQFVSGLRSLDVHLSKMQMINSDIKTPDLNDYKNKIDMTRTQVESDTFNMGINAKEGQKIDEEIILKMKSFYENLKNSKDTNTQSLKLLSLTETENIKSEEGVDDVNVSQYLQSPE